MRKERTVIIHRPFLFSGVFFRQYSFLCIEKRIFVKNVSFMREFKQYQLKSHNTFGIPALCDRFVEFETEADLEKLYQDGLFRQPWMVVGCGANLLFCDDYKGTILHPVSRQVTLLEEKERTVLVRVDAGMVLDDFIALSVSKGWGGVENLSTIPCGVGAAPVQNVGAYGVEAKDVVERVHLFNTKDGSMVEFLNEDCAFGYRDSYFKSHPDYVVVAVDFRLTKYPFHQLRLDYGNLRAALGDSFDEKSEVALSQIRDAVCRVRDSKLPNPSVIGSAGSFFKNPVVDRSVVEKLLVDYPNMPFYEVGDKRKIPAGWMIDQAGWKGFREGNVGVYEKQALVLVNYGGATGMEVWNLALRVAASVKEKFGVEISPEVIRIHS